MTIATAPSYCFPSKSATGKQTAPSRAKTRLANASFSSYCCGDGCGIETSDSIFTKRDESSSSTLRPVSSIFTDKSSKREAAPKLYDVTAPKRAAPLDRVGKRQEECSFEGGAEADVRYWGEQLRVSPIRNCGNADGCELSYDMSYSEMVGESWGVGSEVGATLFQVVSASVSFDYTYEESEETTRTHSIKESVPGGFSGYIVWEPLVACKFSTVGLCTSKY